MRLPSQRAPRSGRHGGPGRIVRRVCAVLAAGLILLTPAQAQTRPTDGGDGPNHGEGGGRGHHGGGSSVPAAIVVPLIALGIVLIARAVRGEDEAPRPTAQPGPRPSAPAVQVRPGAAPATPRPQKSETSRSSKTKSSGGGPQGRPATRAAAGKADDPALIVPGEVLFETRPEVSEAEVARLAQRFRLEKISSETFGLTGTTVHRYRIRGGRPVSDVLSALAADPRIRSAQPNHVYSLSQDASALAATQYAATKMRLAEAHAVATGAGVSIAIIDSGVDPAHPAIRDAIGETFDPVGPPFAPHPHGTAVAGLAAARGDLTSPAPAARVLAIRAFAGDGRARKSGAEGTTMHILRGLDWAAQRAAKIVNMSFAGPRDDKIAEFLAAGAKRGVIYVAAAGNAGPASPPLYPAADPNVIAVTATDADDRLLKVANRGRHLSVAAPGVDVVVASPGGGYGYMSGTSMAAAEVSGAIALMVEAKPDLTPQEARAALTRSAVDLGAPSADPEFGAGRADARAALDAVSPPPVSSTTPPSGVIPAAAAPAGESARP